MGAAGTVDKGVFEGLVRGLGALAGPMLKERLLAIGYDADHPRPHYPSETLRAALDLAGRTVYPLLPPAEADMRLGAATMTGFAETLTGRVLAATLSLVGPNGLLRQLPLYSRFGGPDLWSRVHEVGRSHWRVEIGADLLLPEFNAGMMAELLRRCGVEPTVVVIGREKSHFVLDIRW